MLLSALFFCKIELNIYLLQKTTLLYDFYKNVMSLHKEYLTDSVKIKLLLVDIFTYGYSLKVS